MAKARLKGDAEGRFRTVFGTNEQGNKASWQISKNYFVDLPDQVAEELNDELYDVQGLEQESKTEKQKPSKKKKASSKKGKKKAKKVKASKTSKKKSEESIDERVKEYREDLEDDGKRNYSNDPNKESPGRPKKESGDD